MNRADQSLVGAVVIDSPASRLDSRGDCGFGDYAAIPNALDDLVFSHHALTVGNKEQQERKDLRLNMEARAIAPQLEAGLIKFEALEAKNAWAEIRQVRRLPVKSP